MTYCGLSNLKNQAQKWGRVLQVWLLPTVLYPLFIACLPRACAVTSLPAAWCNKGTKLQKLGVYWIFTEYI